MGESIIARGIESAVKKGQAEANKTADSLIEQNKEIIHLNNQQTVALSVIFKCLKIAFPEKVDVFNKVAIDKRVELDELEK